MPPKYRFGFVMEQMLGHVTHHQNLARWVGEAEDIEAIWMPVYPKQEDMWEKLPVIRNNWSLKASLRAKEQLKAHFSERIPDALFLHTQTVSLFSMPYLKSIPSIISLDATPINYDNVGAEYGHHAGNSWLEQQKFKWYCALFEEARELVTWCQWAKDSLVSDYHISPEKVTVIPPGVDLANWEFGREKIERAPKIGEPLKLLFVGGDFERKGGMYLLEAFKQKLHETCTLDIVTRDVVAEQAARGAQGIQVHRGLTANSDPLKALYANADLFVFPTLADCLPLALMEAMAAGLPIVATDVGALREEVVPNVNGIVVPPKSAEAITEAVSRLVANPTERHQMARRGRELAESRFNAKTNYGAILDMMRRLAQES